MVATSGLQSLLALPLAKYPSFRAVYLLTIPIIAVLTFVSWQGWASLFSAVALALISYARYQISLERLRLFAILSTFCWVGHNLLVASLPGLASDALSLSTGVWMYYRLKTSAEGIS